MTGGCWSARSARPGRRHPSPSPPGPRPVGARRDVDVARRAVRRCGRVAARERRPDDLEPDPPSSGGGALVAGRRQRHRDVRGTDRRPSSSAAVDAGNLTVTKPSGTADGDLLVAITYADPDGSIVTPPSGWSSVGTHCGRRAAPSTPGPRRASRRRGPSPVTRRRRTSRRYCGSPAPAPRVSVTPTWAARPAPAPATPRRRSPRRTTATSSITAVAGIFGVATSFTPPSGRPSAPTCTHAALWAAMEVSTETYSGTSATAPAPPRRRRRRWPRTARSRCR